MLLFFFVVVPAIPILVALISEESTTSYVTGTDCGIELTEKGKKLFQGKEELIEKYVAAANKYNIPWEYLAAIHQQESNFALTSAPQPDLEETDESPQTKVGPMGFLEINWVSGSEQEDDFFTEFPGARTPLSDKGDISNNYYQTLVDLKVIKKYKGLGTDANGDQRADPYHIDDAIFTAAKKLKADGMGEGEVKQALDRYNGRLGFTKQVEQMASEIASLVMVQSCSEQVPTGSVKSMIDHAHEIYKNRTINYVWGGDSYPNFDCSSWVKYMYKKHLGIQLTRTTYTQVKQGKFVPKDQLQPGDLIFFARGSDIYHVGLYVGDGMMIHNANSRLDMKHDTITSGYYHDNYHSARRYTKADSVQ